MEVLRNLDANSLPLYAVLASLVLFALDLMALALRRARATRSGSRDGRSAVPPPGRESTRVRRGGAAG